MLVIGELINASRKTIATLITEQNVQCGGPFGPGDEGLDISFQRQLFQLVDAASIGVQINEACVLSPAKSLSFLTRWTTSQVAGNRRRCASCKLTQLPLPALAKGKAPESGQK